MKSFKGGVHPLRHGGKLSTRDLAVKDSVMPDTVIIPMAMHLGAPSTPCVEKGDHVLAGQLIGEPNGFLGLPVHSGISGTVKSVDARQQLGANPVLCVEIENDFSNEWVELNPLGDVETVNPSLIVPKIKECGVCGMGGATFPTHVKLTIPEGKTCDTIIINGAECETHLTSDFRLMIENPGKIVCGLRAVMRALEVEKGYICIEDNKPEAIQAMQTEAAKHKGITVISLKTKYPQGSEKQLIKAATGREVKQKCLPIDANTIVLNTATAAAICDAIVDGRPLVSRITTITGKVKEPSNLRVTVGTVLSDIIGQCGGYSEEPGKIIMGGAMTGPCAPSDEVVITKGCGGVIIVGQAEAKRYEESACIRCARCVDVCPMGLNPYLIKAACEENDMKAAEKHNVMDCILCGCCSFTCPASRYLSPAFKIMKEKITAAARRNKQ